MTNRPLEQYLILSDGMTQTVVPGWDHHSKESEMLSQNLHQHLLSYLGVSTTLQIPTRSFPKFSLQRKRVIYLSYKCMPDLSLLAQGGFRATQNSQPSVGIWSNASPGVSPVNDIGLFLKHIWAEKELQKGLNWHEWRVVWLNILMLASSGNIVELYLDYIVAFAYIRKLGGNLSFLSLFVLLKS